jgi:hypothetical protein
MDMEIEGHRTEAHGSILRKKLFWIAICALVAIAWLALVWGSDQLGFWLVNRLH